MLVAGRRHQISHVLVPRPCWQSWTRLCVRAIRLLLLGVHSWPAMGEAASRKYANRAVCCVHRHTSRQVSCDLAAEGAGAGTALGSGFSTGTQLCTSSSLEAWAVTYGKDALHT
jgi:hypothetical protein